MMAQKILEFPDQRGLFQKEECLEMDTDLKYPLKRDAESLIRGVRP